MDTLPKCQANITSLTPLIFLHRAAKCYANRISVIHEGTHFTWSQTYERCCSLASSLRALNIGRNDVVSVLAPNIPAMYEMHFAVPMAGAVLNTMNIRLDAKNIATILKHSEAKIFFVDYEFVPKAKEALRILMAEAPLPLVIVIDDINNPTGIRLGELEYEQMVLQGDRQYVAEEIHDEWSPIALNYTSGTTSEPKGVPVYLWTLPMFHCNGWTFTWGRQCGTSSFTRPLQHSLFFLWTCLFFFLSFWALSFLCWALFYYFFLQPSSDTMLKSPTQNQLTMSEVTQQATWNFFLQMCCAPIVFNILLEAKPNERLEIKSKVEILTGGAPPPASLLERIEKLGFHVTHAYGLTEATGPALVCEWQREWNKLPMKDQAQLKARQGVSVLTLADVDVKNLDTMESVPRDGKTMGEIVLRGSGIMMWYYKDPDASSKAFGGGWFRTGDVGVIHPDGYLEIKDRSKDVIISGGENISSVEVESLLYRHPRVLEAAVVAMPHPRWGESPCAFVSLKKQNSGEKGKNDVTEADIIAYCRKNLPHFMVPKVVKFMEELPKTETGKIQKFELRVKAKAFTVLVSENMHNNKNKKSSQVNKKIGGYNEQVLASRL